MKKNISAILLFAVILSAFSACDRQGDGEHVELILGTAGVGGGYYVAGAALAEILTNVMPNVTITSIESPGAVGNPLLLGRGEIDLAVTNLISAWSAFHGVGAYRDGGRIPLVGVVGLMTSILHFMVAADSDIHSIADVRGRRISVGPTGGGGALIFDSMMPFLGITADDITLYNFSHAEGARRLIEGSIDIVAMNVSVPTPVVTNLANAMDVRFLDIEEAFARQVLEGFPYYSFSAIAAGSYRGLTTPAHSLGMQDLLVVRSDMDDELAHQLALAIYESRDALGRMFPPLTEIAFEGFEHSLVRLHPGALRFYRERGISLE